MELYFKNRKEWRKWLEKNHSTSDGVWLIYYKKNSGKPRIPYDEAVEEALCFGWIDSKLKSVNEDYYIQRFTPRRHGSRWSKYNIERVKKLTQLGLMKHEGLIAYEKALDDPKLVYDNRMDGDPEIPQDLLEAFMINQTAYENFLGFSLSNRRMFILWLNDAKRDQTRKSRMEKILEYSVKKIKPGTI